MPRNLKVYYTMIPNGNLHPSAEIPQIRLQGVWLSDVGFQVGDKIQVDYQTVDTQPIIIISKTKES